MSNFFFFGDSISFGQFISPHKIWVNKIANDIEIKFNNNIRVINTSISGNTTRMALERMPHDIQAHGCDYILIEFGMNDCNYWNDHKGLPRVSLKGFESNLCEIIERSRVFGAHKVFMVTNHPTTKIENFLHLDFSYQQKNEIYNTVIRKVAHDNDCILIDVENAFKSNPKVIKNLHEYLLPDKIHLSELGHNLYYNATHRTILDNI